MCILHEAWPVCFKQELTPAVLPASQSVIGVAGLVNCTTIDWFTEWPADALYEVASKQLADEDLGSQEVKANICRVFVTAHQSVADVSKQMLQELKRHNYVTPTNYLETVRGYRYGHAAQQDRGSLLVTLKAACSGCA